MVYKLNLCFEERGFARIYVFAPGSMQARCIVHVQRHEEDLVLDIKKWTTMLYHACTHPLTNPDITSFMKKGPCVLYYGYIWCKFYGLTNALDYWRLEHVERTQHRVSWHAVKIANGKVDTQRTHILGAYKTLTYHWEHVKESARLMRVTLNLSCSRTCCSRVVLYLALPARGNR